MDVVNAAYIEWARFFVLQSLNMNPQSLVDQPSVVTVSSGHLHVFGPSRSMQHWRQSRRKQTGIPGYEWRFCNPAQRGTRRSREAVNTDTQCSSDTTQEKERDQIEWKWFIDSTPSYDFVSLDHRFPLFLVRDSVALPSSQPNPTTSPKIGRLGLPRSVSLTPKPPPPSLYPTLCGGGGRSFGARVPTFLRHRQRFGCARRAQQAGCFHTFFLHNAYPAFPSTKKISIDKRKTAGVPVLKSSNI
ncbi:uncharacterized protein CLUP02_09756 [Colletotrichum lupini]|uniref:Uncharacterized protein n=1 Tax=Colletotrichum lupini TaxID=145971 RepID=A0A9Q8WIX0_9PEZI|nr:uncharacterized protein CLUP02_09756 [Colletotrichum lupini]UQC84260.1 hypothetical protein CLUP02_09756 [Colletotrichum lupini]